MIKFKTGTLWISVMLFSLSGCKHHTGELTYFREPLAESVEVVEYIKPEIRKDLVEVDQVKCELA